MGKWQFNHSFSVYFNLAPHVDFEFCAAALVCYVVIYCYWQLAVNEKQRENWEVKTEKMGSDEETEVSEHETDHGQELSCFQWCYTRARGSMLCWLPPYEQVCWCQFSLVKIKCSYLQLQLKTSFQSKLPINEMFTINRKLNTCYQILQVQTQQTNDENNDDQNRCVICLDRPKNAIFIPCAHGQFCNPCGQELMIRERP